MSYVYLIVILHRICSGLNLTEIEVWVNIATKILTGVIAIIGVMYVKSLKDKAMNATFNFWAQIRVRLSMIKIRLEADKNILQNIYEHPNQEELSPEGSRVAVLKSEIEAFLKYIKEAPDQMPAYHGWNEDFCNMVLMLEDCLVYDICDNKAYFKQTTDDAPPIKYEEELCTVISKICKEIDRKQKEVENIITKKKPSK